MKQRRIILWLGCFLLLGSIQSCTLRPPPAPIDQKSSIVAIKILSIPPAGPGWAKYARCAGFAKLEFKEGNPVHPGEILYSNFRRSDFIYILNAKPGTYAPVLSCRKIRAFSSPLGVPVSVASDFITIFPKELIEDEQFTVKPSEVVFIGELEIELFVFKKFRDSLQEIYMRQFKVFSLDQFKINYLYRGRIKSLKNNKNAKVRFTEQFRNDFKGTAWEHLDIVSTRHP